MKLKEHLGITLILFIICFTFLINVNSKPNKLKNKLQNKLQQKKFNKIIHKNFGKISQKNFSKLLNNSKLKIFRIEPKVLLTYITI